MAMRVLAIETVGMTGSVAALAGDQVLVERRLDTERRSAQTLAPAIQDLLAEVGWQPADLELVAVAQGPGSFTGLRIGITTAKGLAYVLGCQLLGVNTLRAIAERVPTDVPRFSVALDAQRGELFVAEFERQAGGELIGEASTRTITAAAWLEQLPAVAVVTGPALNKLLGRLPVNVSSVDPALWETTAAAVGQLAFRAFQQGARTDVFELAPRYFRRTAAEEQWDRKGIG